MERATCPGGDRCTPRKECAHGGSTRTKAELEEPAFSGHVSEGGKTIRVARSSKDMAGGITGL